MYQESTGVCVITTILKKKDQIICCYCVVNVVHEYVLNMNGT